jgi:hypothetical protein
MKKYFAITVFAIGTLLTSCSKECCTNIILPDVCEDNFSEATYSDWQEAKAAFELAGYNCD